ncbi:MAG: polysaccharide biosynthesis/export family protein [Candidatus Omnitrophota bacterium]
MKKNRLWLSWRICGVVFILLGLTGIPTAAWAEEAESLSSYPAQILQEAGRDDSAYVIGPENFVLIRILGETDTQQTFRVDESGTITHPLVGRIKIAGKTVAEAEHLMEEALKGGYILNPNVTLLVLEHSRFSILGEVRNPGHYEILGQLRLVEAISMAGGFTPVANEKKVKIIRKTETGEIKMEENVEEIMRGGKEDHVFIQAGDVINVSKSFF